MKRTGLLILAIVLNIGGPAQYASSQTDRGASGDQGQAERPAVVPGELIVTFTRVAASTIERIRTAHTRPSLGLESLDRLFVKYGVTAIKPLFPTAHTPNEIRARFPKRTKRASPGAELPDASLTYTLTLAPQADVVAAARAFSADPYVRSAQPNYLATVNTDEGPP